MANLIRLIYASEWFVQLSRRECRVNYGVITVTVYNYGINYN